MDTKPNEKEFDFKARYKVEGYDGIAWYSTGHAIEYTEEKWELIEDDADPECEHSYIYVEPEEIENTDKVICVMVGDDREFTFEVTELTKLNDDDYCPECGQIGCTAYAGVYSDV